MLKKIYNRFRKSIDHFRGEKPNIIKWANFLAEITKASKIKRLKNSIIKKHIKSNVNIDFIKLNINKEILDDSNETEFPKVIWTMWWQGEENAPTIVKSTLYYMRKFAEKHGYNVIVIDSKNIEEYVIIPDTIYRKLETKKINLANFSDLVRFMLIDQHGGVWLDSTMYVDSEFPISVLERKFSSINHPDGLDISMDDNITNKRWVSFCLSGTKGNIVAKSMKYFMIDQIENNKVLPDYFMVDFGLDYLYDEFEEIRDILVSIPEYSSQKDIFWLDINRNSRFDKKEWERELSINKIFKTTYKIGDILPSSYFDYLEKRKL
jgi:putative glycosyltransferase